MKRQQRRHRQMWIAPAVAACVALLMAGRDDIRRFREMHRM